MLQEQAAEKQSFRRQRTWPVALPRLEIVQWLPPLLLVLATLLALMAAYRVRPFVRIDLGDYYDSAYIDDFHDREVGAIARGTLTTWPAQQDTLELPGGRAGIWMATIQAAEGQPADALSLVAVAINDVRVDIARRTDRELVVIIPPEIAKDDRLVVRLVPALSGGAPLPAGLAGQIELAPAQTYRWSRGQSEIRLPNIGRGDWLVTLSAIVQHPNGAPLDATVEANGSVVARLPEGAELRRLQLFVPAALVPTGDLTLRINSRTFDDPRPLGVLIEKVRVAPAGRGIWLPPSGGLLYAPVIALCLYICLLRMTQRWWLATALVLLAVLGGAWALGTARYPGVFMLPWLAGLAIWSVALLLALERLVAWVFRRAGVPLSMGLRNALLLVFFAGYWIKAGGMLYPYFVGIDVRQQMAWVQWILDGKLALLYGTNNPLNQLTMPVAEWGANRPVIPYSPWFHMFATSFALVPLPMVLTANMFSALVDSSRVFLIALLGRKGGLSGRESLFAALLYAVTPATFLLHSWGNIPTTFGIWWTLVCTTYILAAYRRLDRPWVFVTLVLLLIITLLIYTVMAVFMLLFLALLIATLWLTSRRAETRRPVIALGLATAAALGLATLIYYGQYIPPIIERTIPYFTQATTAGSSAAVPHDSFAVYLAKYWPRMDYLRRSGAYGLQLALPLGLLGMLLVRSRRLRAVLACWLAVALVFLVIGSRVSLVDKHLFYIIPALALGVGLLLGRLWHRGVPARLLVASLYIFALVAALDMWVYRIANVQQ